MQSCTQISCWHFGCTPSLNLVFDDYQCAYGVMAIASLQRMPTTWYLVDSAVGYIMLQNMSHNMLGHLLRRWVDYIPTQL